MNAPLARQLVTSRRSGAQPRAVLLPEWLRFSEGLYLMVYAIFVMALLAFFPSGLLGLAERLWLRSSKSKA